MSYTYLLEQGEESSAECFLDIPASVLLRSNLTAGESYSNDSETASSRNSQYGMTSAPLTGGRGGGESTLCAADFLVKIYQQQAKVQGLTESALACGGRWPGSLTKYDPDTCSWRTHQCLLLGGLESFSETWPRWGIMRDGECWALSMQVHRTNGKESGSSPWIGTPTARMARRSPEFADGRLPTPAEYVWATPCAKDARPITGGNLFMTSTGTVRARNADGSTSQRGLVEQVRWPTPQAQDAKNINQTKSQYQTLPKAMCSTGVGGRLNPTWVEWLMGWPLGWTDLKPLETDKFQQWLRSHGEYLED